MATNTGKNHRDGSVSDRTQRNHPSGTGTTKRDTNTGQFMDYSKTGFKGVAKEKDKRRG